MSVPTLLNLGFSWHWVAFSWCVKSSHSGSMSANETASLSMWSLDCWWLFISCIRKKAAVKQRANCVYALSPRTVNKWGYHRPLKLTLLTSSLWRALLVRGFFDEDGVCCSRSTVLLRASEFSCGSGWIVGTAPDISNRCFFNPISFMKFFSKLSGEKWLPQMTELSDGSMKFALFTCTNLIHCRRKLKSFGNLCTLWPVLLEFPQNWTTQRFTIVTKHKKKVSGKLISGSPVFPKWRHILKWRVFRRRSIMALSMSCFSAKRAHFEILITDLFYPRHHL